MADIPRDDSQEEKNDKREFIRETIVKQEKPRRRGRALLWTLALALVFGGTSSLAFVVSQPFWEGRFGETEPQEDISLARDDTSAAPADTDAAEESSEETTQSNLVTVDRDELESLVAEAVERSSSDLSDVTSIFTSLNSMIAEANKSLVVITVSTTDLDWFDNEISSDHQGCGMIAAITGQEVLILTDSQLVSGQATIHVSFGNHGEAYGSCKQTDSTTGMAVVSVPVSSLDSSTLSYVQAITLGNSYLTTQGTPVVAMGSPLGTIRSIGFGMISYVNSNVQEEDSQVRLLCTDITGVSSASGFLLNLNGEVVGWITTRYSSSERANVIRALSISELKGKIEKLFNGEAIASLGIKGQTVTTEIAAERQIPQGVYITQSVSGKPAYQAGIQSGDILTALDGVAVTSLEQLQTRMESFSATAQIQVTVQRSGRDGYEELNFTVQLVAR